MTSFLEFMISEAFKFTFIVNTLQSSFVVFISFPQMILRGVEVKLLKFFHVPQPGQLWFQEVAAQDVEAFVWFLKLDIVFTLHLQPIFRGKA